MQRLIYGDFRWKGLRQHRIEQDTVGAASHRVHGAGQAAINVRSRGQASLEVRRQENERCGSGDLNLHRIATDPVYRQHYGRRTAAR